MSQFTNTELDATINEVWDQEVDDARYATAVGMPRIDNKSALVEKSGDKINFSVNQKYSVGLVASDGGFTPAAFTVSTFQLIVNQHYYVSIETTDKAEAQSFYDPKSTFPKSAGKTFGEKYDTDIFAEFPNLTGTGAGTDSNPVIFGSDAALTAILNLVNANVPIRDGSGSFFIPPVGYYLGLLKEAQLTMANTMGVAKNVLTSGYEFPILGIPIFMSTLLTNNSGVTGKIGALVHKSAIAIGMQKNNEIKRAEATAAAKLSFIVVIQSLYGLKTKRADHGARIYVKN